MSSVRKISGNVAWLAADRLGRLVLSALSWIVVIRYLGPAAYGEFSYIYATYLLFVPVVTFGLDTVVVRQIVRRPDQRAAILGAALALRLSIAVVSWIALVGWVQLSIAEPGAWIVAAVLGLGLVGTAFDVVDLDFQTRIASRWTVLAKAVPFFMGVALRIGVVVAGGGFVALAASVTLESLLNIVGLAVVAGRQGLGLRGYRFDLAVARQLAREGLPFFVGGMAVVVYMRIDQVMLLHVNGTTELGLYAAAARLSEFFNFAPMVLVASAAPVLHQLREQDRVQFAQRLGELLGGLVTVGVGIALVLSLGAPLIVPLLLGDRYAAAVPILAIHVWSLVFVFAGVGQSVWDTAEGQGNWMVVRTVLGAVTNVGLNLWLLPIYGGIGAAIATLISYALSAWAGNLLGSATRPMFWLQLRSPLLFLTALGRRYVRAL
ncbi:MAG: flippase [Anaerolineales bacterium]|nr:flippase [Anaerolineales bacterium]